MESSLHCRALITTSESPSRIIEEKPQSWAKRIALAATKASTSSVQEGNLIFLDREAKTSLWFLLDWDLVQGIAQMQLLSFPLTFFLITFSSFYLDKIIKGMWLKANFPNFNLNSWKILYTVHTRSQSKLHY